MKKTTLMAVLVAGSFVASGFGQAATESCDVSGRKESVASGNGSSESRWFVFALSNNEDEVMQVTIDVHDFFENGPAIFTWHIVDADGNVIESEIRRSNNHQASASLELNTGSGTVDESVAGPSVEDPFPTGVSGDKQWPGDEPVEKVYWVVSFATHTDRSLDWEWSVLSSVSDCAPPPEVDMESGEGARLYTHEDLDGGVNAQAGAYAPLNIWPLYVTDGVRATTIQDAQLDATAGGSPLIAWAWEWQSGDGIQVRGPNGGTLAESGACRETPRYRHCQGWGSAFPPGVYRFHVDGSTLPGPEDQNEPGPYMLLADTQLPPGEG